MTDTLPLAKTEDVGIEFAPVRTFTMLGTADDLQVNGKLYSADYVMRALDAHDDLVKALRNFVDMHRLGGAVASMPELAGKVHRTVEAGVAALARTKGQGGV